MACAAGGPRPAGRRARRATVYRSGPVDAYYYPVRPELLDRKVLVHDLRRLERKLYGTSVARAGLEQEYARVVELEAQVEAERDSAVQVRRSLVGTYSALLEALDQVDRGLKTGRSAPAWENERLVKLRETIRRLRRHDKAGGEDEGGALTEAAARACGEMGSILVDRLEIALLAPSPAHKRRGRRKGCWGDDSDSDAADAADEEDGPRRREAALEALLEAKEAERARLAEETARLRATEAALGRRIEAMEAEAEDLRAKLDEQCLLETRERQMLLNERIGRREFRDGVLDLITKLADGIHRRLGFLPASCRAELNAFISHLAELDASDDRLPALPLGSLAEQDADQFARFKSIPTPPSQTP